MARRPRTEDERSMDSLMDAMTNVVGILLLILIVSSLGITNAVKKIIANLPQISVEQLEEMKSSRKKTMDNFQALMSTFNNAIQAKIPEEEALQLALALEKFEKENADLASKTSDLNALLAEVKKLEPIKEEKEKRNAEAAKKLNDLEAALAAKPQLSEAPAREITLPDPRPADPGDSVFYLACKNQRLYVIGEPYDLMVRMRDLLDQNFKDLAYAGDEIGSYVFDLKTTKRDENGRLMSYVINYQARTRRDQESIAFLDQIPLKTLQNPNGISVYKTLFGTTQDAQESKKEWPVRKWRLDRSKVEAFFKKSEGKGDFTYRPVFEGDRIKMTLKPNPQGGLGEDQLLSANSPFVSLAKQASVERRVILLFFVADDSFEIYLKARDFVAGMGISAGWDLWNGEIVPDLGPNRRKDSVTYKLDTLDKQTYLALARASGAKLTEKVNARIAGFEGELAAVKVPETLKGAEIATFQEGLRAYRTEWANSIAGYVRALYMTPLTAGEATRNEVLAIDDDQHPPVIMQVRIFTPHNPPSAPKPAPAGAKGKGAGRTPLILD